VTNFSFFEPFFLFLVTSKSVQQNDMTHLKEGDQAPDFSGINEKDEPVSLSDFKGRKLILFFYPKDNTPGCTAEACSLRDNFGELREKGFELLGVSPDSAKKHQNFISKFDFPFSLLADTEHEVLNAYGVWGRKKFMGKEYDGVHRTTFVIDEEGTIEKVFTKVKTKDHAGQIMAAYE
jgi:peroxiredoxin Q/BCP